MLTEINAGVEWWRQRIQHAGSIQNIGTPHQFSHFANLANKMLQQKYQNHWYIDQPTRGQAFRALLNDESGPDPLLAQALATAGLPLSLFGHWGVVVWIDSGSVSVRCKGGEIFELYRAPVASPKKAQPSYQPSQTLSPPRRTSPQLREVVNAPSYQPSYVPAYYPPQQYLPSYNGQRVTVY